MIVLNWFAIFIWCWMIFYLSSIPGLKTGLGTWDFILRKLAHFLEFAWLELLLFLAISRDTEKNAKKIVFWTGFIAFFYAVSDEFHQSFIPNRDGNLRDIFIDFLGICLMAYLILRRFSEGKTQKA